MIEVDYIRLVIVGGNHIIDARKWVLSIQYMCSMNNNSLHVDTWWVSVRSSTHWITADRVTEAVYIAQFKDLEGITILYENTDLWPAVQKVMNQRIADTKKIEWCMS